MNELSKNPELFLPRLAGEDRTRLVFFGNERIATGISSRAIILSSLIKAGYDVAAVVLSQKAVVSRTVTISEVERVAKEKNIPTLLPKKLAEIKRELTAMKANIAVLVAYGQVVPAEIINLFPAGIVNIHPSLLPRYRGSTPIEQVIIDGTGETGVSLMKLVEKMDAGPVFVQKKLELNGSETKQTIADSLAKMGRDLLLDSLPKILSGELSGVSQNNSQATYCRKIEKSAGLVDWQKTAAQIEREIRAYSGWPKSRTEIFGHKIILTGGRAANGPGDGDLVLECGSGWLEILSLVAPSGRSMTGAEFIRGYKKD